MVPVGNDCLTVVSMVLPCYRNSTSTEATDTWHRGMLWQPLIRMLIDEHLDALALAWFGGRAWRPALRPALRPSWVHSKQCHEWKNA
jgi:hypothetical protein